MAWQHSGSGYQEFDFVAKAYNKQWGAPLENTPANSPLLSYAMEIGTDWFFYVLYFWCLMIASCSANPQDIKSGEETDDVKAGNNSKDDEIPETLIIAECLPNLFALFPKCFMPLQTTGLAKSP